MGWSRYFRRRQWDEERAQELDAYLEAEIADNLSRGMPADEARNAARRKLGNSMRIREEIYGMNTIGMVDVFQQDLRYALRVLRKSPGFALVSILSLALGVGANSAIFSVIHGVLLRSLPYPDASRLMRVVQPDNQGEVTMPELEFFKEHSKVFAAAAGRRGAPSRMLSAGDHTEWIRTMPVTADFFGTLGTMPEQGREFRPEETRRGGPQAVIVSHALWQRVFGADPQILGRVVSLDNVNYTVVGVLPQSFWHTQAADAFLPLRNSGTADDQGTNTEMIARLKPGVSLGQARAEMATLTEDFRRTLEEPGKYRGLTVVPYQDWLVGDVRTNLLLMFGAVAVLLLIATCNLAGLLLARLATRQKEIAMRLALGSSRGRLIRQFLVENLLLTMAGGVAGLFVARGLLAALLALIPFQLPAAAPIELDATALCFTLAVALATGLVFSLAPILAASRTDLQEALKSGGRSGGSARQRARSVLVVSEVALSVTLLVSAGLLIESLYRMHREPLGFEPHGLMTFSTPATAAQSRNVDRLRGFDSALLERLRTMPGVENAATVSVLPLTGQGNFPTERDGHPDQDIGGMELRIVTPSYLATMGIPVIVGRSFESRDTEAALPVILVNQTVARRWWGDGSPLNDRVAVGRWKGRDIGDSGEKPRVVVGVVADTKSVYLKDPPRPTVYLPVAQTKWYDHGMNWVVRGNLSSGFAEQVRQAVAELEPKQRIDRIRSMDDIVASTKADSRFDAWLFGLFAGLALLLAAIGVYGLLAYSVERRTHEIGTRMALGASPWNVLALVIRQGAGLIGIGLILGLGGALAVTRSLASLLFGVRATDPASFGGVAALLLMVGLLASYFPARRATKVDPVTALRQE